MKVIFSTLITLAFLTSQAQFVGTLETQTYGDAGNLNQTWTIGKSAIKMHFQYQSDDGVYKIDMIAKKGNADLIVITDGPSDKSYSLVPTGHITSSLDIRKMAFSKGGLTVEGQKFKGSNKSHQCAVWMNNLDIDLSPYAKFFADEPGFAVAIGNQAKGFPTKSMVTTHNGELIYSLTLLNNNAHKIDESAFSVPNGFEKRELVESQPAK